MANERVQPPVALIVEDDPRSLMVRQRLFDQCGFLTLGARTFGEAAHELWSSRIDIVVADIILQADEPSDKSGAEFARFARQGRPGLPIVALSGIFSELSEADRCSFDDFLMKGELSPLALESKIQEWRNLALARRAVGRDHAPSRKVDVFLSHNSKDKPTVRRLARGLRDKGVSVWLDEWELVPGQPWQEAIEGIIASTRTAAVLVGCDGIGPWEDREMRACLSEFVRRGVAIIPVYDRNATYLVPPARLSERRAGLRASDARSGLRTSTTASKAIFST